MFNRKILITIVLMFICGVWASAAIAVVPAYIFVDGTCGNDDWTGIYTVCSGPDGFKRTIQAALDAVPDGGTVLVKPGTYTGNGNRDLDFHGKAVRLSGSGPDTTIIDSGGTAAERHRAFHFYSGENESTVIEGFKITGGMEWKGAAVLCENSSPKFVNCAFQANEAIDDDTGGGAVYNDNASGIFEGCTFADNIAYPSASYGGAITNKSSHPTLKDCTFTGNRSWSGGAIYNTYTSNPSLENCTFIGNQAARGGAMCNSPGSTPTLSQCVFNSNAAGDFGGAINNSQCNPVLTHCIFTNNSSNVGGAIANSTAGPFLINCLFTANSAASTGGAVSNDTSTSIIVNCTIYGNSAAHGGGIAAYDDSSVSVSNSILWANELNQIYRDDPACCQVIFSCIEHTFPGLGNIGLNPLFADPLGDDGVLGTEDDDFYINAGSPCIDAGNNSIVPPLLSKDMAGLARFIDDISTPDTGSGPPPIVDMGAYEHQGVFYVDSSATGAETGATWADAFKFLQDALAAAGPGAEIRIAQGTYKPDQGAAANYNDRNESFTLTGPLVLKGGYAGVASPSPDTRDIQTYATTLSGDLHGNDSGPVEPGNTSRSENSYHVIAIHEDARDIVLDGLTVTGGNANGNYADHTDSGGGIYKNHYDSEITIIDCTIIANTANYGGGMSNNGQAAIIRCRFLGNNAQWGAGLNNRYSSGPTPVKLVNCLFSGNAAAQAGGGINTAAASTECTNCTFAGNRAEGTGFYRGGGINGDDDTYMTLTNCILWGNSNVDGMLEAAQIFQDSLSQTHVYYCCVQGWTGILGGDGNFANDPLYIDPDGADNTLGTEDDNLRLSAGSLCINAGDPDYTPEPDPFDLDGNDRIIDGYVDIGAYEVQDGGPVLDVIYVDDSAAGANNGSSWANAFTSLQNALAVATSGYEVRVAQGTYKPDYGSSVAPGDRNATFQLKNGVVIKGGYAGVGQPVPNARDIAQYPTVLSGDLAADDGSDFENNSENSYHVVTGTGTNATAVIDGCTITAGNADGSYPANRGGGINIEGTSSPTFLNCTIARNTAQSSGGGMIVSSAYSSVTMKRCTFFGNRSGYSGGALYNYKGEDLLLTHCIFRENKAVNGGALSNFLGSMTIQNCTFTGNTAGDFYGGQGGALHHWGNNSGDYFTLGNCSVVGNSALGTDSAGQGGGLYVNDGTARIDNCIFWNNSDAEGADQSAQIHNAGGSSLIANCCIQGFTGGGTANIGDDPLLVNDDGPDNIFGTEDDNLRLLAGSPCLDAGSNTAVPGYLTEDMDGSPRIANGTVDIGAYEGAAPGIITSTQAITVPEGFLVSFTFVLSQDPLGPIQVTVTHSGDTDIELESTPTVNLDSSNYNVPQTVELIGAGDPDFVNGVAMITLTAPGFHPAGVTATELDNEASAVLYVDAAAGPGGNGTTWATAFNTLQNALSAMIAYPQFNEIRVAQGTYRPDQGAGITPGDRDATFLLSDDMTLKGGYAGATQPEPGLRDITAYQTILSGDLAANDAPVEDPCDLLTEPTRSENSKHVLTAANCGRSTLIDGFTITAGNANGSAEAHQYGGGILDGKPTINNCTIVGNSAMAAGGGISFYNASHTEGALLTDSTVASNVAGVGGGINGVVEINNCIITDNKAILYNGGGLKLPYSTETTITDTLFSNNSSAYDGGAVSIGASETDVLFTRCTFSGNTARNDAGAIIIDGCTCGSNVQLDQCTLTGNASQRDGGAILTYGYSEVGLNSCLVTGNSAGCNGGAICDGRYYDDGGSRIINSTLAHNTAGGTGGAIQYGTYSRRYRTLTNSILWYNSDGEGQTGDSSQICLSDSDCVPAVSYCCIQALPSLFSGNNNIDAQPLFADADGPDGIAGNEDDNLRLQVSSPCIDQGNNDPAGTEDLDGNPRILGAAVDMGAYEFVTSLQWNRYDIIDLGTLGGERSLAFSINNYRQIVGWALNADGKTRATLFDYANPANNRDLGTLGGNRSEARSINIHGDSVGKALIDETSYFHATLFDPANPAYNQNLENNTNDTSEAWSINDLGQIVGSARLPNWDWKATLFDPANPAGNIDLSGSLENPYGSDNSCALSINNSGQIVGYAHTGTTSVHNRAVFFDPTGAGANVIMTPEAEDGGQAWSINDAGQIVGASWKTGGAALFNPAEPGNNFSLGALPEAHGSAAYAINNRGQIVGAVTFVDEYSDYYDNAAIFDPAGTANNKNLNELIDDPDGWVLSIAYGINDAGWIVGQGINHDGLRHAFLLIPKTQQPDLIAHYKLDETEGSIAEDSAGDNDGALHGNPLWQPFDGRIDGALLFDGNGDYVNCGSSPAFDLTSQMTVVAWVKINAVNCDWQTVIAKGDSAWRLSTAEDEYRYHFAVTGGPPWNFINGDIVVGQDEWNQVCGTYDGADLRLYINGVEDPVGAVPELGGITTNDRDVLIGENVQANERYWDGAIDDVRIYNYALSPAQVADLYYPMVIYVDSTAAGADNGSSWQNAYRSLQDAIAAAVAGAEIRVAQGAYTPDTGAAITPGDRQATFQLKNGVTIKGGYAGLAGPEPDARDIQAYVTALTGDLAGNDGPDQANRADNARHVVTGSGTDTTATLDGFTIMGGQSDFHGGGMYNVAGSPTIIDCIFTKNAAEMGGGIFNTDHSSPSMTRCIFTSNTIYSDYDGAAVANTQHSSPRLIDCVFTYNMAPSGTATIYNYSSSNPTLTNCVFSDNVDLFGTMYNYTNSNPVLSRCVFRGNASSAIYNNNSDPIISNCIFADNESYDGAGIHNYDSSPTVTNCTFTGNIAQNKGGGIYSRGDSHPILTNSIFWHNTAGVSAGQELYTEYYYGYAASITVNFSCIEGGHSGVFVDSSSTLNFGPGNIAQDPCFFDPANGDYHLKSLGWRWDPIRDEWTFDRITSRCIDAGNPGDPLGDEPLTVPPDPNNEFSTNLRINMGAYGGTEEASLPPLGWALLPDIDNNGTVDFRDMACTGKDWTCTTAHMPCDFDRSGVINAMDVAIISENWLKTTTWQKTGD
ncbi:MAG: right-handed parallel beta-helix repeat-containing protein [Sedimentisphaerales bacterium]|nr:right-handed parallel beta-helix repeat-containing protein [Sedimentisphaerales bacterium]